MASNEDMASNEGRRARKIARRSERKIALRREKKQAAAAEKKKIASQQAKPSAPGPGPKLDSGPSTTNFPDECLYPLLTPEEMLHTVLDVTFSEAFAGTYVVRDESKTGKAKKKSMTDEEWLEEHLKECEALMAEQPRV